MNNVMPYLFIFQNYLERIIWEKKKEDYSECFKSIYYIIFIVEFNSITFLQQEHTKLLLLALRPQIS